MSGGPWLQRLRPAARQSMHGVWRFGPRTGARWGDRGIAHLTIGNVRDSKRGNPERALDEADGLGSAERVVEEDAATHSDRLLQRRVKLQQCGGLNYPRHKARLDTTIRRVTPHAFRLENRRLSDACMNKTLRLQLEGKIRFLRKSSSKLIFLVVERNFEQFQVILDQSELEEGGVSAEDFKSALRPLLRGDSISVVGFPCRTERGELSIKATELPVLLSPAIAPIPMTLVKEDTRAQKRHLELLVKAEASEVLRLRSEIITWLRTFFGQRDYVEVQTPILGEHVGGATARPFVTSATEMADKELALRIAPELWLKRLVVAGFDRVFEIGPVFRNEGLDASHNPEFTMCEAYAAYDDLGALITQTKRMMAQLSFHCGAFMMTKRLTTLRPPTPDYWAESSFRKVEFIPGLEASLGIVFPNLEEDEAGALRYLTGLLSGRDELDLAAGMTLPKLLDQLAGTYLERDSFDGPLLITHHPACMAPLAKSFLCPVTGQLVSARAELFARGLEIVNMYEEENDPYKQSAKLYAQARAARPGRHAGVDESYVRALECGLPPTAGWGCGVDRLVMLFSGRPRISDVLSFGNLRNVVNQV